MARITIKVERTVRSEAARPSRDGRRAALAVLACIAAYLLVGGMATAAPGQSSAATLTSIAPHTVLNNVAIAANKSSSPVVIGGSTTVPTDAIRVLLTVTVSKGSAPGTLLAYPAGNPLGGSGDALHWTTGQTASGTFTERVGLSNEVTFLNNGSGSVTVLAKVAGYYTAVNASDIQGTGGNGGDVLTNDGAGGAAWRPTGIADNAYASHLTAGIELTSAYTAVDSLALPAGSYAVTTTIQDFNIGDTYGTDQFACQLLAPDSAVIGEADGILTPTFYFGDLSIQGLITTAGGTVTLQCHDSGISGAPGSITGDSLMATQVGMAHGTVTTAKRTAQATTSR